MLRIEWDKRDLAHQILSWNSYSIIDRWIPLFVYVDDVEISGLKDIPGGDVTHVLFFFSELLSVIQLFDPEKLKNLYPFNESVPQENLVTGGGFELSFAYDKNTDLLTINYTNKGIQEWRTITLPLKDFAEGALYAAKEFVSEVQKISPEKSVNDSCLSSLQVTYNTIREWYEERYDEPAGEKYVIPPPHYG